MKPIMTFASASAIALMAATAANAEMLKFNDLTVNADLEAADANALEYYPDLAQDIETMIVDKTRDMVGDTPFRVEVNMINVALDGSPALPESGEFNTLMGSVSVLTGSDELPVENFTINMFATAGAAPVQDGIVIPPSEGDYYMALTDAFTTEAAERLHEVDVTGDAPTDNDS